MPPRLKRTVSAPLKLQHPTSIALVGETPENIQRDCLGLFELTKEKANGKSVYALVGCEQGMLWFAGGWIVGNREDLGSKTGGLWAPDGSLRPEAVSAKWKVAGERTWTEAKGVSVIHGAELESELTSAAQTVSVVGATPSNLQRSFVGVFDKLPQRINGCPAYKLKEADTVLMYKQGSFWWVGDLARQSRLRSCDGALKPELIRALWEVWDGQRKKWAVAPDLECVTKQQIRQAVRASQL